MEHIEKEREEILGSGVPGVEAAEEVKELESGAREYITEYDEKLWEQLGHTDDELCDIEWEEVHPLIHQVWNDGYEIAGGDAEVIEGKIHLCCFPSTKDRKEEEVEE
ncbi:MAG: hypothetical protein SVE93_03505 [Candidatus Thermoplasmatota archaeon]|nr:hypothetical protein [Candidatus Thermoplasmatota archaeon]